MEGKSASISNSSFTGNLIQGDVGGNAEVHIKSESNNQSNKDVTMVSEGDTYNVNQAGAVGRYASSDNNTFQSAQKKTLAEAAAEIQKLLKQLDQTDPIATEPKKIAYVNDKTTPGLKQRTVSALQAGGEAAIEEFLDNPYVNVGKAIVKAWMEAD